MNATGFRVLVAEDEQTFGLTVTRFLQKAGHEVKICTTGKSALKALDTADWDVLLLDLKLPDADGVDILARVRKEHPDLQTIIVTGFANVQSAIDTMRLGAFDYLTKPPNFEELGMRVEKAGEKTGLERENRRLRFQVQRNLSSDILTRSPVFQKVLRTIEMVAGARTPVLIEGESGVGKELVAQHAHRLSPRANKGFVDLNCAAVPSSLLESELFGYERGAFTGAANEKPGLVEVADGGTLFLDEVGEMIPEIQSKFLRVLDSGTFYRVGATRKRRADFRLVCATNRDLKGEVAAGRFRKDLFFRVNGVKVVIPPLRERPEDIPLLVEHFVEKYNRRLGKRIERLDDEAMQLLLAYAWPGNIRELENLMERSVLFADGPVVLASVTATMVSWGAFGSAPLYPVPFVPAPSLIALPLFALLGGLVAWTGVVFRGGVGASERLFKQIHLPLEARAAIGGLIVGLLAWGIPEVWGNGFDGVREVLAATIAPAVLLPLLLAKIVATSSSLGSGGSGGVFTPTLLIGAAAGALFGIGAETLLPALHVAPVFFTLAGMTAAIASTTFAPITALIMVFEMCQNYGAVMPLAVVTVTATWVARSLRRDSIYTESLRRRGVDFDVAFEQMALASLRAEDLIRTDPQTVAADAPVADVLDLFARSRGTAVYVMREGRLVGAIDLRDAFQVADQTRRRETLTAVDLVRDVPRVNPKTPLDEVMRRFSQLELVQLPVVTLHDPDYLVGSVARSDVVAALDREVLRRRMLLTKYLGAKVPAELDARRGGDLAIDEHPVPAAWIGRTLEAVDPYRAGGLFPLGVKPGGERAGEEIAPVPADYTFAEGDRVVSLGSRTALSHVSV